MAVEGNLAQVSVISVIPPAWKSLPLAMGYSPVIVLGHQSLVDRVGGGGWGRGWRVGSGVSGTKDGEQRREPLAQRAESRKRGNCSTSPW